MRQKMRLWMMGMCLGLMLGAPAWPQDRPLVLVTTADIAALAAAVAGDMVTLEVVLPAGADPHVFTVTADQIRSFRQAELIIYAHSASMEFETVLRKALPQLPALDFPDYAAQGAVLHDAPGYPQNYHGYWLGLENAAAIARAIATRLGDLGLPEPVLQGRLQLFERELAAQTKLARNIAAERGFAGRPALAVIPGVCENIHNFGLPVGDVLMAEGSGTVVGKRLEETVAGLREGRYSAIFCPLSMRQSRQGEAARQIAADSGAPLIYVHFLDINLEEETFLTQRAAEIAAVAGAGKSLQGDESASAGRSMGAAGILLLALLGSIVGLMLSRYLHRPRKPSCGAGIFDPEEPGPPGGAASP